MSFEQDGKLFESLFDVVATDDVGMASVADLVFVALPQFAIQEAVEHLSRVLKRSATVALVPAPAMSVDVMRQLSAVDVSVVGFQRVPYISRVAEYGKRVRISSDRAVHRVAFSNASQIESLSGEFSCWFGGSVSRLSSFLTFVFNNSNPLLHPSRMVVLFRNWRERFYPENPPFYAEWSDESSELYIAADRELLTVIRAADSTGDCLRDYEDVLSHYDVRDANELTLKIRSIAAFKNILSPMREDSGRWVPDFCSRYFTEDIPFGTMAIQKWARRCAVATPTIDRMIEQIEKEIRQ